MVGVAVGDERLLDGLRGVYVDACRAAAKAVAGLAEKIFGAHGCVKIVR
jgi:hypothetical protein